jgi:prepilin signal peptidase PulO-like enzyme (type II secretory pathway)
MARRLACPACGTPITFAQAIGTSEFAIPCRQCATRLQVRLHTAVPTFIGILALAWTVSQYGVGWQLAAAIAVLIAVLAVTANLFGIVTKAPPYMHDAELAKKLRLGQGGSTGPFDTSDGDGGGD